jgi:sugar lactone lactonase YvrE
MAFSFKFLRNRWLPSVLSLLTAYSVVSAEAPGTITTVAGGGQKGLGDGGLALEARLSSPRFLALDHDGNLYISDEAAGWIRKVGLDGIITTFAGKGGIGDFGDGGPAKDALMESPNGLAFDRNGNLLITDKGNHKIRRVDRNGIITTFAGTGEAGYSGDDGPAISAMLYSPTALTVDPDNNIYVSDTGNHVIRRITPDGTIHTVAGNGLVGSDGDGGSALNARMVAPAGLASDRLGNLYIADENAYRIRKVDLKGVITTVAGNGMEGTRGDGDAAVMASIRQPVDVAVDSAGNIFFSDENSARVRKVDTQGVISTIVGTGIGGFAGDGGSSTQALISWPVGLALDNAGNLYLTDNCNSRIRRVQAIAAPRWDFTTGGAAIIGDVDGDGKISIGDVIFTLAILVNGQVVSPQESDRADVDRDGSVTIRDAVLLLRAVVGMVRIDRSEVVAKIGEQ